MPSPYYVAQRATALVGRLHCSHNAPSDGRAVWHPSMSVSLSPYHYHSSLTHEPSGQPRYRCSCCALSDESTDSEPDVPRCRLLSGRTTRFVLLLILCSALPRQRTRHVDEALRGPHGFICRLHLRCLQRLERR